MSCLNCRRKLSSWVGIGERKTRFKCLQASTASPCVKNPGVKPQPQNTFVCMHYFEDACVSHGSYPTNWGLYGLFHVTNL